MEAEKIQKKQLHLFRFFDQSVKTTHNIIFKYILDLRHLKRFIFYHIERGHLKKA